MDRALVFLLALASTGLIADPFEAPDFNALCQDTASTRDCAILTNNLGSARFAAGKFRQAELLFTRAISLWGVENAPSEKLCKMYYNLGADYSAEERYADAERFYRLALAGYREQADVSRQVEVLNRLSEVLLGQRRFKEAEQMDHQAIDMAERQLGTSNPEVAAGIANLGKLMIARHKFSEAEPLLERAERIDRQNFAPDHPRIGYDLYNEGVAAVGRKHYGDGERLYWQSDAILEKALPPDHPEIGRVIAHLATLYRLEGRLEESEPLYRRALNILQQAWGPESPHLLVVLESYEAVLRKRQEYAEAENVEVRRTKIRVVQALRDSN
jgi:tetratricopeptide (TPR) repeat protein